MINLVSVLMIIVWAVIVPYLLGNLVSRVCGDRRGVVTMSIAYGFMLMCVLFLFAAVPMILLRTPFHVLKYVWVGITVSLSVISLILIRKDKGQKTLGTAEFVRGILSDRFTACIAAMIIIVFETGLLTFKMHVDTDDARFVAEAMEAVENDSMLLRHPITGQYFGVATGEQRKDITAPYPVFIGLFSSLTGVHPAICAHTVFPFLYIPLSYLVFALAGDWLFEGDIRRKGLFLLFLSLIHLFSFETIYAAGYTLLTIIWQGRSVAAMIMLPLLWYILIKISDKEKISAGDYILIMVACLANAMLSNMAALFAFLMSLAYMTVVAVRRRSIRTAVFSIFSIIPVTALIIIGRVLSNTDILYRGSGIVKIL